MQRDQDLLATNHTIRQRTMTATKKRMIPSSDINEMTDDMFNRKDEVCDWSMALTAEAVNNERD